MEKLYHWLDTSLLAPVLIIIFLGMVLFIAWKGCKNAIDYPENTYTGSNHEIEIMRKAQKEKEVAFKDRSNIDETDMNFMSHIN